MAKKKKVKIIATVPAKKLSRKQLKEFKKIIIEENKWQGRIVE